MTTFQKYFEKVSMWCHSLSQEQRDDLADANFQKTWNDLCDAEINFLYSEVRPTPPVADAHPTPTVSAEEVLKDKLNIKIRLTDEFWGTFNRVIKPVVVAAMHEFADYRFRTPATEGEKGKSVPDRIFYIDETRKLINEFLKEEMSMSRFVEILNEKATGVPAMERFHTEYASTICSLSFGSRDWATDIWPFNVSDSSRFPSLIQISRCLVSQPIISCIALTSFVGVVVDMVWFINGLIFFSVLMWS